MWVGKEEEGCVRDTVYMYGCSFRMKDFGTMATPHPWLPCTQVVSQASHPHGRGLAHNTSWSSGQTTFYLKHSCSQQYKGWNSTCGTRV